MYCSATYHPISDTVQKKEGIQSTPFEAMMQVIIIFTKLRKITDKWVWWNTHNSIFFPAVCKVINIDAPDVFKLYG